jgi:hypothetical protein
MKDSERKLGPMAGAVAVAIGFIFAAAADHVFFHVRARSDQSRLFLVPNSGQQASQLDLKRMEILVVAPSQDVRDQYSIVFEYPIQAATSPGQEQPPQVQQQLDLSDEQVQLIDRKLFQAETVWHVGNSMK